MQENESSRNRHRDWVLRTGPSLSCDRLSRHKSRLLNAGFSASDRLRHPDLQRLGSPSVSHSKTALVPTLPSISPDREGLSTFLHSRFEAAKESVGNI